MQSILVNHLFDIIIAVIALAVIISSFFKPTFRYFRWLVGLVVSVVTMYVIKAVDFFNFVETYLAELFTKLNFRNVTDAILKFFGKENLPIEKADTVYHLFVLLAVGLLVFILVNLIMGLSHSAKVRRANKKDNYVYNSPITSFILSLLVVASGIVIVTVTFAALPFDIDYVSQSVIMKTTYGLLETVLNFIHSVIPAILPLSEYVEKIAGIKVA